MTARWMHCLAVTVVVLYSFGYLRAEPEAASRARAAGVLFQQFETVAYSSTDVLSRIDNPGLSVPNNGPNLSLPLALRLPFVQLIGGLRSLGHNAMPELLKNYSGVLAGAKGFTPPDGIGMFSSQDCYIGILRPNGHSIIDSDVSASRYESIDGNRVWTWSAPPYEGYPQPTTFYITEIEHAYLVMANNLDAFRETLRELSIGNTKERTKVGNWEAPPNDDKYWVYRSIRSSEATHSADPTGAVRQTATVTLRFALDAETMTGHVEADSLDEDFKTNLNRLPASEVLHYEPKGTGIWQAAIPLSKDPATTTALYTVFSLFGFGVVL